MCSRQKSDVHSQSIAMLNSTTATFAAKNFEYPAPETAKFMLPYMVNLRLPTLASIRTPTATVCNSVQERVLVIENSPNNLKLSNLMRHAEFRRYRHMQSQKIIADFVRIQIWYLHTKILVLDGFICMKNLGRNWSSKAEEASSSPPLFDLNEPNQS